MVASRLIKREKGSLPVDVRRSKTSLLKPPNEYRERENEKWELTKQRMGFEVTDRDRV